MRKSLLFLFAIFTFTSLDGQEVRTINGTSNNLIHSNMGATQGEILRVASNGYDDLVSEPAGHDRPNPRKISNYLFAQEGLINDARGLSDYAWVFGQFIDHDIVLVGDSEEEFMGVPVPAFDAHFDPTGTGLVMIPMHRSAFDPTSGTSADNPRRNNNEITAWIDASNIYGSDDYRASWLRSFQNGKLKVAAGNLLPYNTIDGELNSAIDIDAPSMAMENPTQEKWFVAGDIRANENTLLTSMHTLFVREHNRICDEILAKNPSWNDQVIYQAARRKVAAIIQAIVYYEWLPSLGIEMPVYENYNSEVNANIMNAFSAAAFRYGHTTINSDILRIDDTGNTMPAGHTTLREAFFNPNSLLEGGGIEPLLKGMTTQVQQKFDSKMIDDLRNFLFGQPGAGGLDLAAINIQRGRDRGLPDYNTIRADFGLERITSFSELTADPTVNQTFADLYGDVNNIDPWVGMLAENHMPDALFGETAMRIVEKQFEDLRDGDRFYFENDPAFTTVEKNEIKSTFLADVIRRNTYISVPDEVFWAKPVQTSVAVAEVISADNQLLSYPNPTTGNFVIGLNSLVDGAGMVEVYNNLGQKVASKNITLIEGENQFDVELPTALNDGIYQVLLRVEEGMIATKVLLVR